MAKQVESAGILVEVVHAGVSILLSQVDVEHNTVLLLGGFSHFYTQSSYTKSQVKLTQVDSPSSYGKLLSKTTTEIDCQKQKHKL